MLSVYALSLLLIGLSGVLIDSHRRSWQCARQDNASSDRDRRFALAQYRRRMQASAIIGLLGAAIGVWPIVPRTPFWMTVYLAALLGTCAAIFALALLDIVASQQNVRRLRGEQLAAQAKLAHEMRAKGETSESDRKATLPGKSNVTAPDHRP